MLTLEERKNKANHYQEAIKAFLSQERFSDPELQLILVRWLELLNLPQTGSTEGFAEYLQLNLDSIQGIIKIINSHRLNASAELLSIQKGKKAIQSYGDNC